MLNLGRNIGERIYIPAIDTWITIGGIQGRKVRLLFESPHDILFYREELWNELPSSEKLAAKANHR